MKNWTLRWSKWSRRCKLWRRSTRINSSSFQRSAASAITWSRWTCPTLQWPMTKSTLVSMRRPIVSPHLSRLFSNRTNSNSSNSNHRHLTQITLLIKLWKITAVLLVLFPIILRSTILVLGTLALSSNSLWMISTTRLESASSLLTPQFRMAPVPLLVEESPKWYRKIQANMWRRSRPRSKPLALALL